MSTALPEIHHPLLKAAEVEAALVERSHNYNPMSGSKQAPISDMGKLVKVPIQVNSMFFL